MKLPIFHILLTCFLLSGCATMKELQEARAAEAVAAVELNSQEGQLLAAQNDLEVARLEHGAESDRVRSLELQISEISVARQQAQELRIQAQAHTTEITKKLQKKTTTAVAIGDAGVQIVGLLGTLFGINGIGGIAGGVWGLARQRLTGAVAT